MTLHRRVLFSGGHRIPATAAAAATHANGLPLCCPSKLARMLDWKSRTTVCTGGAVADRIFNGTSVCNNSRQKFSPTVRQWNHERNDNVVVSLCIGRTQMDVTIASHPSRCQPIQALPSIPLLTSATTTPTTSTPSQHTSRSRIQRDAAIQAVTLALNGALSTRTAGCSSESNNATTTTTTMTPTMPTATTLAALLVSWPLQRDSGRCGAACGRVWHILDALWMTSRPATATATANNWRDIPTCLYDRHGTHCDEDEWGRSPNHSRIPQSHITQHTASTDQYWSTSSEGNDHCNDNVDSSSVLRTPCSEATLQWIDYCRVHWPRFPVILPLPVHHWDSLRSMPEKSGVENFEPSRRRFDNPSTSSWRRPPPWYPESPNHYTNSSRLGGWYGSLDDATSRRQQRCNLLSEQRRDDILAAWIQSRATRRDNTIRHDTNVQQYGTTSSKKTCTNSSAAQNAA